MAFCEAQEGTGANVTGIPHVNPPSLHQNPTSSWIFSSVRRAKSRNEREVCVSSTLIGGRAEIAGGFPVSHTQSTIRQQISLMCAGWDPEGKPTPEPVIGTGFRRLASHLIVRLQRRPPSGRARRSACLSRCNSPYPRTEAPRTRRTIPPKEARCTPPSGQGVR